jgi:hypothetical protein
MGQVSLKSFVFSLVIMYASALVTFRLSTTPRGSRSFADFVRAPLYARKNKLVSIPASEVAAAIGMNPYKPPDEVFTNLWNKWSPETFIGQTKIAEQFEALSRLSPDKQDLMQAASKTVVKDAKEATQLLSNATSIIERSADIANDDKEKVIELLKTQISTGHGTRTEDKVVEKVSRDEGITFQRDTELYSVPIIHFDEDDASGREFVVRGKIDRLQVDEDGELVLVEVKSRMKRLFHEVREYEWVQVQCYLQMLPQQIRKAKLIEQYLEDTATHEIERDDDFWQNEIEPALVRFCVELDTAMEGTVATQPREE